MVWSNETSLAELLYSNIFFVTVQDEKIGFRCFYQFLFYAFILERASVEL